MIFTADIHLSELCPISRNEGKSNWIDAQVGKLYQMTDYGRKNNQYEIIIGGDFFHKFTDCTTLVNKVMKWLTSNSEFNFYIIYGNHDLKNHNLEYNEQTSLLTFGFLPNVTVIPDQKSIEIEGKTVDFFSFGQKLEDKGGDIAIIHVFAYKNKPWHDAPEAGNYRNVSSDLKGYDLIVCGDNHERFICEYDNQIFLNCGSMSRRTIDQKDFDPHFHVMEDWDIISVPFVIKEDVWDMKKSKIEKLKDSAIVDVVKKFKNLIVADLDFEDNLAKYCKTNNISNKIEDLITENMT